MPIGDLLFAELSQRPAQFQRRQHIGPSAAEKFDVVRQIIRFIEMPADQTGSADEVSSNAATTAATLLPHKPGGGRRGPISATGWASSAKGAQRQAARLSRVELVETY